MYQEKGLFRPYCKMVKEVVDVPVICAGRMDNPDMALESLEKGECDIVSLGRPAAGGSRLREQAAGRRMAQVRPCISCQEGCMAVCRSTP